jgi:hypothetical protein
VLLTVRGHLLRGKTNDYSFQVLNDTRSMKILERTPDPGKERCSFRIYAIQLTTPSTVSQTELAKRGDIP